MGYCKNCGSVLTAGARFCASCGTPVQTDLTYIAAPPAGGGYQQNAGSQGTNGVPQYPGAVSEENGQATGSMPYPNVPPYGNAEQIYGNSQMMHGAPHANMPPYGQGTQMNAAGRVYESSLPPYAVGQVYGNSLPPYADGQVYESSLPPYAEGQVYESSLPPYAVGQVYANSLPPYAVGQVYESSLPPYVVGQPYENNASIYMAGGNCAGNPYEPYGRAVQPQSSRKALMIAGLVAGLMIAVSVIVLVVLLTKDKGHRTYQQAVTIFMDGVKEQNLDKISEAFPERVREELRQELLGTLAYEYTEIRSELYTESDVWADLNDVLEWYCGENVTMSHTVTEAEPIADYRLREYERDFLENFHYEVSLSSGYTAKVEIVYGGSEGEYSSRMSIKTAEINGKWYVIDLN